MKKTFFLIVIAFSLVALGSCKKAYTCVCVFTSAANGARLDSNIATIDAKNESDAQAMCDVDSATGYRVNNRNAIENCSLR